MTGIENHCEAELEELLRRQPNRDKIITRSGIWVG